MEMRNFNKLSQLTDDESGSPETPIQIKTNAAYAKDLSSYERACGEDPQLRSFDSALHERTNLVIEKLASGVEFEYWSFDSLREVIQCLFDMDHEVLKVLLRDKEEIRKDKDLFSLVKMYFQSTVKTEGFRYELENCLKRATRSLLTIHDAVQLFQEEAEIPVNVSKEKEKYKNTLEELKRFKSEGDPFSEWFFLYFDMGIDHQIMMLEEVHKRKRKFDRALKNFKLRLRVWSMVFVTAFISGLIFSVVSAAVAAPQVVAVIASSLEAPVGSAGKWCNSLWIKFQNEFRGHTHIIEGTIIQTNISVKEMDDVNALVSRVEVEIESLLKTAEFAVTAEKLVRLKIDEIKKKFDAYTKAIEELKKQADEYRKNLTNAKTVILARITRHPTGSPSERGTSVIREPKSDVNPKEIGMFQFEASSSRDDDLNQTKDDSFTDSETNCVITSNLQNCAENKRVEPVIVEKTKENVSGSSTMVRYNKPSPEYKLFINFHGNDLRHGFVSDLVKALKRDGVNVDIDLDELPRGDHLTELLLNEIEESKIALVIFSSGYTESRWCLNELVRIKELMERCKLVVIPIFYEVDPLEVTQLKGEFGVKFWNLWRITRDHHIIKWKEALESVASTAGIYSKKHCSDSEFIIVIVEKVLQIISLWEGECAELYTGKEGKHETCPNKHRLFGMEQRLEKVEKKLEFDSNKTRIIGVVGMPGIGKTTLAMMVHHKWNCKFIRCLPLLDIRKKSEEYGTAWLRKTLLEVLLEGKFPVISDKTTHESVKDKLLQTKVLVVLDDVSDKKQLEFLLGDLDWIKKGSKIIITTCDKSLLEGLVSDTYVVPLLNDREAFQLFNYHAFADKICRPTENVSMLSKMFVDYARGHPLALSLLGSELRGTDKVNWEHKLATMTTSSSKMFPDVWRSSTDQLNERHKEVFLDIVCFFKSEDEYFVRSLLDSGDPDSVDSVSEVRDLANKFLITISDGRIEMDDLLYAFGKNLTSPRWLRLWNDKDIINDLNMIKSSMTDNNVRGFFLDTSKLKKNIFLDSSTFINMLNLRYIKIYDSCCPRQCSADNKLYFPDGLVFLLKEVRYLHWLKFPLHELPTDFIPENLVDLRLPYSKIERVWEGVKDTPRLKWVDLSYSNKLLNLSALSNAKNLLSLNLEGCTSLDVLPEGIQNMTSLVFLNLKGCTRLRFLPRVNLISLKTLILSGCKNFEEFHLISESLEVLHLDGTAIERLTPTIGKCQKLILLNLKNCKRLEFLPHCIGELKALEELILTGCSSLKNLSHVMESMKHVQSLVFDRIGAKEMPIIQCEGILDGQALADMDLQPYDPKEWPRGLNGGCSLRRLCLSGNDFVSLQTDIGKLYNLNWLEVKQCKMLRSIPVLPPNLQYFNAHGCDSLERVANPLALPGLSEKIHATFIFSNCNKLDENAKDSIISYTWWRSQLVLEALSRYIGGSVLQGFTGTCFPGGEVPACFNHQDSGSVLRPNIPPHLCDYRFTGISLCAVISFPGYHNHKNTLVVKCSCVFVNKNGSCSRFSYTVGSWSKSSYTPGKLEPSHVFIGYTSLLDIQKHGEEEDEEGCSHMEASFEFQVTDGTKVLEGFEVLKCGLRLVYATDERENISWDAKTGVISERITNIPGEATSYGNYRIHDDIQYESYFGLTLGRNETFYGAAKSDGTPNLQKSSSNKKVDLLNEERDTREYIYLWRFFINQLNERQKDVFFDIVYLFKSEEEYFVKSILNPENPEAVCEVRDLAELFLVTISNGRVEMHDELYRLAKDLGSPGWHRLCNYKDIEKLTQMKHQEANNVRGIFLDMSEIREIITLECTTFTDMHNLLYLKIYDSSCPRHCKADCNLYFPDALDFPLEEVRYLHWVKFPLHELPPDFRPGNLVDLRLPYSKIERVWEGAKDTPRLKWVDLRHSSKLLDLSALSRAENLERLNLEGCTSLDELPVEIQNMKSLSFLNLRGCTRLCYLPKMNLISLKTLILSGCINLKEFQLISESVEYLHLDATSIKGLPPAIQNLQRLVVLNLKNCKMLERLPICLGNLTCLDELILSGCSRLKNFTDVRNSLKHLQVLLFDGTGAIKMPNILCFTESESEGPADIVLQPIGSYSTVSKWPCGFDGVSSLRHLCLSGNDFVSLQPDIWKLYNLKWLDVKQCKKLRFVPMLPPRLHYFDAHGCDSLERVANPLALPLLSEQIHSKFIFSNCNNLDEDAKDSIISYTGWRSKLVVDELTRHNKGSILEAFTGTCFPGWEVPAWFSHQAFGPVLKTKLPPHWSDNKITGIALCAVISFPNYQEQRNHLVVKCNCAFNNEDGSRIRFSCIIGSWSESSYTPGRIEQSHVFIGYTSTLDIKKHGEEADEEGCSHTEAVFEFQVTDGTQVLEGCEVMKCGFSLYYATDELRVKSSTRAPVEAHHGIAYSENGRGRYVPGVDTRLTGELQQQHSADQIPAVASSSQAGLLRNHSQIFVSFHGGELRRTFVTHLVSALTDAGINVFTDNEKGNGIELQKFCKRIEESKIALVIFSERYIESHFCLDELVTMDKLAKEDKLLVIPVFCNVKPSDVKKLKGEFGRRFKEMRVRYKDEQDKVLKWETSVKSTAKKTGIHSELYGENASLVEATAEAVQRALKKVSEGNSKSLGGENMAVYCIIAFFAIIILSLLMYILDFTFARPSNWSLVNLLTLIVLVLSCFGLSISAAETRRNNVVQLHDYL